MEIIRPLFKEKAREIIKTRKGEIRIGEIAAFPEPDKDLVQNLKSSRAKFVLLGIPEDIGIRANFGRAGSYSAWQPALENILSIQSNEFFTGKELMILGEIEVRDFMSKSKDLSPKNTDDLNSLRKITADIDDRVYPIIQVIVSQNKIPIVIGGGHNNAFGMIKGAYLGLTQKNKRKKINAINCDAHTDLRPVEGRHSGNGFTYALEKKYLNKYSVLGVHENYLTDRSMHLLKKNKTNISFISFEDIFVRGNLSFEKALKNSMNFVSNNPCGIELDLDCITNVPSSAKTSSGLSPTQARQYAYACGNNLNCAYFHIAEGAPVLAHLKADNKTGKLIGYLVTDFIKGYLEKK